MPHFAHPELADRAINRSPGRHIAGGLDTKPLSTFVIPKQAEKPATYSVANTLI